MLRGGGVLPDNAPMKKLAIFVVMSSVLVSGQTATGPAAGSSAPPSAAALQSAGHGFPGRSRGAETPSPVSKLLELLVERRLRRRYEECASYLDNRPLVQLS